MDFLWLAGRVFLPSSPTRFKPLSGIFTLYPSPSIKHFFRPNFVVLNSSRGITMHPAENLPLPPHGEDIESPPGNELQAPSDDEQDFIKN